MRRVDLDFVQLALSSDMNLDVYVIHIGSSLRLAIVKLSVFLNTSQRKKKAGGFFEEFCRIIL